MGGKYGSTREIVIDVAWLSTYHSAVEKKQCKDPKTKSFYILRSGVVDPMLVVKVNFALSIAREVEPFLQTFKETSQYSNVYYQAV